MLKFFAEKMWVAFAVQKLLTFFSAKNIRILYTEFAKTVNEMTLNELVKLTTLWTTGPWTRRLQTMKTVKAKISLCIHVWAFTDSLICVFTVHLCPEDTSSGGATHMKTQQLQIKGSFICVEVSWPSQPNGVMSSAVSLPNHTFTGQV